MSVNHIEIQPLHLIGKDERGCTYDYSVRENGNYILITRQKDSVSGNTFHKGINAATNPKTFVLIHGTIEFSYRHIDNTTHETITINKPSLILIKPLVTHAVKALSDIIILECNSIADIKEDRHFAPVKLTERERA